MYKICFIATIPAVVDAFLHSHILTASERYEITVICGLEDKYLVANIPANFIFLPITRKPTPWQDFLIFVKLCKLFYVHKFCIVHSIMPKTGILAMFAAWVMRVPVRIHTFTGQVWVTKKGSVRYFLKWIDVLIGFFTTCALADSPSQRGFLISENILLASKIKVLGIGSISGVNVLRFHADSQWRQNIRESLGISKIAKIILYVGRLNSDKGVLNLAAAFNLLANYQEDVNLLFVGAEEDINFAHIQEICSLYRERLHYVNYTKHPEHYMAAGDIFCLPSYREGFGLTIIEAAACGLPAVASRIYGITDAVEENKTGLLFPVGDIEELVACLKKLLEDDELRLAMGEQARLRTLNDFSSASITREMMLLYDKLLMA